MTLTAAPGRGFSLPIWELLLPPALWLLWRYREDREARFGAAWLFGVFVFLSCMRFKRADYLLPAYPGAALLLGCILERAWPALRRAPLPACCGVLGVALG